MSASAAVAVLAELFPEDGIVVLESPSSTIAVRNRLRLSRQRRREAMMRINLLLVDRGELELVDRIEPCGASERIERLRDWLDSSAQRQA